MGGVDQGLTFLVHGGFASAKNGLNHFFRHHTMQPVARQQHDLPRLQLQRIVANPNRRRYPHRHRQHMPHGVGLQRGLVQPQRPTDFLNPGLVFGNRPQICIAEDVRPTVSNTGNRNVMLAGFEDSDQGGPHAFQPGIQRRFRQHLLIGIFHGSQQGRSIAMLGAGKDFSNAFDREARSAFSATGAAHAVCQ